MEAARADGAFYWHRGSSRSTPVRLRTVAEVSVYVAAAGAVCTGSGGT